MAHRVVLTDKAESDIESILKWFSDQRATQAGSRWFTLLMGKLGTLESHPERCAVIPESDIVGEEIREILLGRGRYKYRLLFKIDGKTVIMLRVWHGSRNSITLGDIPL